MKNLFLVVFFLSLFWFSCSNNNAASTEQEEALKSEIQRLDSINQVLDKKVTDLEKTEEELKSLLEELETE